MVPRAVLMKSGLISINTARQNISKTTVSVNTVRQVNTAHLKTIVNVARPMSYLSKTAHLTVKRPIHKNTTFKNNNIDQRVNTVSGKKIITARRKAVVNAVKGNSFNVVKASACWIQVSDSLGDPNRELVRFTNYEEIDGGYVAFGGNPKGGKITGKAEAVNTACYMQNRVLVVKPHNKTPYELFHGRTPILSFMRPFRCTVTILNTIDHLGKFDSKADEGFFIGYSLNSIVFRVFNSRTRIVEENLHIRFNENTPNVVGSRPDWLFDIDALTRTMNYEPIVASTRSNGWTADSPFSQNPKSSQDDESKSLSDIGKKVDEDPRKESESIELPFDPNMPALEDYSTFEFLRDDEDDGAEVDMNNLNTTIQSTQKDFMVYQMDIESVFLYGKIEKEVYVCQPPGFEDPDFPDRVYKVKKALHKGDILVVQVYVDDIIFGSTKKELCNCIESLIAREISDGVLLENLHYRWDYNIANGNSKCPLLKDEDGERSGCFIWKSVRNRRVGANSINRSGICGGFKFVVDKGKAKKSVRLMMEKLFRMKLELILVTQSNAG
ncbi:retrovirus-related pol polyprotein from transposon TNT 1-94 [Tanacetum coccineum]